jgi:hypothetical protein
MAWCSVKAKRHTHPLQRAEMFTVIRRADMIGPRGQEHNEWTLLKLKMDYLAQQANI